MTPTVFRARLTAGWVTHMSRAAPTTVPVSITDRNASTCRRLSEGFILRRAGVAMFSQARELRIEGSEQVQALSFAADGSAHRLEADVVLLHHGVVPNTQLSRLLRGRS